MSFQWILDKAEAFSIDRKKMVATTTSRDGQVRVVSRGTQPQKFTVSLPNGLLWSVIKADVVAAEVLDRITTATLTIPYAKFPWYYGNVAPASNESYTVRCIQFPEWTIFQRDQVSWSGAFVFIEVI
jgi:hypothetical protein